MKGYKETKGKVVALKEILNEDLTINCYEATIDFDKPTIKLGQCIIGQKDE